MARFLLAIPLVLALCLPVLGQADSSAVRDTSSAVAPKPAPKTVNIPRPKTNWSRIKDLFM